MIKGYLDREQCRCAYRFVARLSIVVETAIFTKFLRGYHPQTPVIKSLLYSPPKKYIYVRQVCE